MQVSRWALLATVALLTGLAFTQLGRATELNDIRAAGVLRVVVLSTEPPLGFIDPQTREPIGYEVDIARALARHIGVRLQTIAAPLAQRIPLLLSQHADIAVADLTITSRRAGIVDFSIPYLVTGLQLLVRKGNSDRIGDYGSARIGADRESTQQEYLIGDFSGARLVLYDDAPQSLQALRDRSVQAIVQDGVVLAALLAGAPDRDDFKALHDYLTREFIGVGLAKDSKQLLDEVNTALLDLEQSGEAARIYHAWFDTLGNRFKERNFTIAVPCRALSGWSRDDCQSTGLPP